jgi:hypothetical protein
MNTGNTPGADRILPGILLMIGFCMSAPMLDVAAKLAARTLPVGQITAARFVIQAALMLPVCLWLGLRLRPGPGTAGLLAWRALFLVLSTYFFIAAIRVMPIADALPKLVDGLADLVALGIVDRAGPAVGPVDVENLGVVRGGHGRRPPWKGGGRARGPGGGGQRSMISMVWAAAIRARRSAFCSRAQRVMAAVAFGPS